MAWRLLTWLVLVASLLAACAPTPAAAPTRAPVQTEPKAEVKAPPASSGSKELRMMTGPQGGSWYPLGGAIADLAQKANAISISVAPGGGIANVEGVELGKADLGFGNAVSTVDAVHGREPFKAKTQNVTHVATLYYQYFQIVTPADSGIKTVAELKGKAIATQPKGNTGEQMTRDILEAYGLSYNDLAKVHFVNYNDAVELIKNRQADAFFLVTTIPASAVMDLNTARPVRLISVPDDKFQWLNKKNGGYAKRIIPQNTYPDVDYDTSTFGTYTHLIAARNLPEETVYNLTKTLATNVEALAAVVRDMKGVTPKEFAADVGVPLHPGALRYYREVGVLKN